jgi:hypothetical protein
MRDEFDVEVRRSGRQFAGAVALSVVVLLVVFAARWA